MTDQDPDATARTPEDPRAPGDEHAPGAADVTDEHPDPATTADPAATAAEEAADELVDPGSAGEPGSEDPVADDPVAVVERERDEYLDALRRKQAEFENFRKRMMREGASQRITGHAEVAERMLDVLDDFDRTLEAAGDVEPGFLKGVQLVHDKLARVLADFGVARIDEAGVTFDPTRHEAVQQVEAEEVRDEPVVTEVLRPGYELGGRTLRAAMVTVEQ